MNRIATSASKSFRWAGKPPHEFASARVAWRFGDEAKGTVVRPGISAAREFEIHADTCMGLLPATLPLMPTARTKGQTSLGARFSAWKGNGARNRCIFTAGDPHDGQWALTRMAFST